MTYTVKLSKKNQGAIPVSVLKDLGLNPNEGNELVIYKNLNGEYVIATYQQMISNLKGSMGRMLSVKIKNRLAKMTPNEILEAENQAIMSGRISKFKVGL